MNRQRLPLLPRTPRLLLGALLAAAMLTLSAPALRAGEAVARTGSALAIVPADASFFATLLRNKEQMDLLYNSNAYKTLRALPLIKEAYEKASKEIAKDPNNPIAFYQNFVKDKDNKELVDLLLEGLSDECFVYGGKDWVGFLQLAGEVNNAQSWAPLTALAAGTDPQKAQVHAVLKTLQDGRDKLKLPDLVLGFKLKNSSRAVNQIKRLEKILAGLAETMLPQIKGKISRKKAGGGDFVTVELDGSLIPWDDVPIKDYEERKDEFDDLLKHARKMTLALSVGVKDGYLMIALTSAVSDLERIGPKVKALADRDEFKPLARFADRPLTGIGYTSKELRAMAATGQYDAESFGKMIKETLAKVPQLSEERKKAIVKDLDALLAESKKYMPVFGASLSFAYLTPGGYEGYAYDYTRHDHLKGVSCRLQQHFGGSPIFAAAFACRPDVEYYAQSVKWLKVLYGHVEGAVLDAAPQEGKDAYQQFAKALFPVLQRFDDITRKQLLPAIKESGLGIVFDARWSSKQWHNQMPPMDRAMPGPELGLLVGISDAKGFERAMTDYRKTLNELYEKVRDVVPNRENIPEFKIPAPESEKGANGLLLFYPFPDEAGLDRQFQPTVGIGKNVSVLALSKKHADRLLANTPLTFKSGPLARKGDLVGVALLDWPALMDAVAPWVEFAARAAAEAGAADPKAKDQLAEVLKQGKVVFEVLKCFQGSSSASYLEDGKLVTHSEVRIKDLAKAP